MSSGGFFFLSVVKKKQQQTQQRRTWFRVLCGLQQIKHLLWHLIENALQSMVDLANLSDMEENKKDTRETKIGKVLEKAVNIKGYHISGIR